MPAARAVIAVLEGGLRGLLCLSLFLMMAITTIDVVMRYVLGAPLRGAFEVVTFLLAAAAFLALPLVAGKGEHISVDLLRPILRVGARKAQQLVIDLASAALMAVIAVQMWRHAGLVSSAGQVTGFLEWPVAPVVYGMSVLCFMTVGVHLGLFASRLRALGPAPDDDAAPRG